MASPSFVAAGTAGFPGFGVAPGLPSGHAANDILVRIVGGHYGVTPTTPSGWTLKHSYTTGPGNRSCHVYWKRDSGSESAPSAVTLGATDDGSLDLIVAYRGCPTSGDPFDAVGTWQDNSSGTAFTTSAITTSSAQTLIIHVGVLDGGAANTWTWTGAATTTSTTAGNSNGTFLSLGAGHGALAAAGSSGTATLTTDSTQASSSVLLALLPAAVSYEPYVVSKGTANAATTGTVTPTYPGSISADDIAFLLAINHQPNGVGAISTPSGYSEAAQGTYQNNSSTNQGRAALFWRRCTGSESGTVSVSSSGDTGTDCCMFAQIYIVRGCITSGDPYDAVTARYGPGNATITYDSVTVSGSERTLLAFCAQADDAPGAGTPSGYSRAVTIDTTTTGTDAALSLDVKGNVSSDGSVTASNGETLGWATFHVAATPPSTGTTGTGAFTAGGPSVAASGTLTVTGTSAFTAGTPVIAAAGTSTVTGDGAFTVGSPVITASGSVGDEVTGDGAFTTGAPSIAASGTPTVTGAAAFTVGSPAVAAAGAPTVTGTAAFTTGTPSVVGSSHIRPMPRITGRTTYGTNTPSLLQDGQFRASFAWSGNSSSWCAVDIGTGYGNILVQLGHEDNSSGDLRPAWNSGSNAGFTAYRLQVSADSTNGSDGSWTTVATVTSNPYIYRQHLIDFTGQRMLKLLADASITVDEIEIWDARDGATDTWIFLGDSITNRTTKRGDQTGVGNQPSFQANIYSAKNAWPAQIGGGFVGQGAVFLESHISDLLTDFPHVKHWAISIGTNDASAGSGGLASWSATMQSLITAIKNAGRNVYLARIPYTTDSAYGYPTNTALYNEDATYGIDALKAANGLFGPDLYTYFQNHTSELEDGVHPDETGCDSWNLLWAESVEALYADPVSAAAFTVGGPTIAASGTTTVTGTGAFTVGSPTVAASGTTTVSGAAAFTVGAPSINASGTVGDAVTGTGAFTTGTPVVASSGSPIVTGAGAFATGTPTVAASGAPVVSGAATFSVGAVSISSSGTPAVTGTGALALSAPLFSAEGSPHVTGAGAFTTGSPTVAGRQAAPVTFHRLTSSPTGGGTRTTSARGRTSTSSTET